MHAPTTDAAEQLAHEAFTEAQRLFSDIMLPLSPSKSSVLLFTTDVAEQGRLLSVWDHNAGSHRRVQLTSDTIEEFLAHVQLRGRRLLYTDPGTQQVFGIDEVGCIRRFTIDSIRDYAREAAGVRVRLAPLVNSTRCLKVHSQRRSVIRLLASSSWGPDTCTLSQVANAFVQAACSLHMFMIVGIGTSTQLQRIRRLDTALSRL
eukprot:6293271-Amphidinium_carterae.1